ncbi:MBL fold metallo-hydrolase [Maritimibacter sp. UBA3975]|uniref:MBL fold metallo-hydrolase n=1 Tax=Maritimibacter sp. UBA3975 TaxID=1946833 RepID=UPI0025BC5F4D|nr:MBL fold metallo-hydrolase [Maritimibacter sp. UBA3975]
MDQSTTFVTLGTGGGPMQQETRAQPAHLLQVGGMSILIDCGEGAATQMKKAGVDFRNLDHIVLTHHHFDHIGSLFAILGLSMMTQRRDPLTIYGPKGTAQIVEGLAAACDVPNDIGFGVPGQTLPHPRDFVTVQELSPGDVATIGEVTLTCCENTHYRGEADFGTPGHISLSVRFDTSDRSILFTGDTGPCTAVETLAQGVDLLVGEMMDVDLTMSRVKANYPDMPAEREAMIRTHLSDHHLTAEQLGELASRASAKKVVAVHFAPATVTPDTAGTYAARIASVFEGEIHMGEDLGRY